MTNEQEPQRAPRLSPATVAATATSVLVQVQITAQGNTHDVVPLLIAVLLVLVGAYRPSQPET